MARVIVSFDTDCLRAASTATARRALSAGSGEPPSFAAIVISRTSLVVIFARLLALISRFFCSHWRPMAAQSTRRAPRPRLRGGGAMLARAPSSGREPRARHHPQPRARVMRLVRPLAVLSLALAAGCGHDEPARWVALPAAKGQPRAERPAGALLADGERVEFEELDGGLWGKVAVSKDAWKPVKSFDVVSAPAPLIGLGQPGYRLEVDGKECELVSAPGDSVTKTIREFAPGSFIYWRNALYLGLAPGVAPPETATLRVRLDSGALDGAGCHLVRGRRFSGKGLSVWPGRTLERVLDIPAGRVLRFGIASELASA